MKEAGKEASSVISVFVDGTQCLTLLDSVCPRSIVSIKLCRTWVNKDVSNQNKCGFLGSSSVKTIVCFCEFWIQIFDLFSFTPSTYFI